MKILKYTTHALPILVLTLALLLTGCSEAEKIQKAFVLSETECSVMAEETKKLTLENRGNADVGDYTLAWMTENPDVATVTDDGTVTGIAPGKTKITVVLRTAKEEVYFHSNVTVTENTTPPSSISFQNTVYALGEGEVLDLNEQISVSPANAVLQALTWTSSNPSIAAVSGGIVSPVSQGISTITATTADGKISASCTIRVSGITVPPTGIAFDEISYVIVTGETRKLSFTVEPENASGYSILWTSSDSEIATVSEGSVTGVKEGEVTLRATLNTEQGEIFAECTVTVEPAPEVSVPATRLQLTPTTLTIPEDNDGPFKFSCTVSPANCTDLPVWTTSRPDLISINKNTGEFTLLKAPTDEPGSVLITCTVGELSKSAVVYIEPRKPVLEIAFNEDSVLYDKAPHNTVELVAGYVGSEDLPQVTWSSSDVTVATVSAEGVVTGLKAGTCTVTATSKSDPTVTATYTVTVEKAPYLALKVGETVAIDPALIPPDPINWNYLETYVELDPENRTVTGKKEAIETPTTVSCFSQSTEEFFPIDVYVFPAE